MRKKWERNNSYWRQVVLGTSSNSNKYSPNTSNKSRENAPIHWQGKFIYIYIYKHYESATLLAFDMNISGEHKSRQESCQRRVNKVEQAGKVHDRRLGRTYTETIWHITLVVWNVVIILVDVVPKQWCVCSVGWVCHKCLRAPLALRHAMNGTIGPLSSLSSYPSPKAGSLFRTIHHFGHFWAECSQVGVGVAEHVSYHELDSSHLAT